MEPVLTEDNVFQAAEDMNDIVNEREYNDSWNRVQLQSKTVVKVSFDKKSDKAQVLPDIGVLKKAHVEAIVGSRLLQWTSTLQVQIMKPVRSIPWDPLQESYFSSKISLKSTLLGVFKQALGEMARSGCPLNFLGRDLKSRLRWVCR